MRGLEEFDELMGQIIGGITRIQKIDEKSNPKSILYVCSRNLCLCLELMCSDRKLCFCL